MSRTLPPECTDVLEAFRASCFGYPQGVAELAAALGMSATMLYNKANPHDVGHPPTLADAVLVIRATNNPLVVQALAHLAGGAFIPLPRTGMIDQDELLALVVEWMKEQGRFFSEFDHALADKQISAKEMRTLTAQAHKVVTSFPVARRAAGNDVRAARMKPDFHLHTNITPGQSIDFQRDFMHAFAADIRAACADIPPVLIPNKKLATVLPFPTARRPVSTSVTKPTEVPSCSNAICPNPTSVG